MNDNELKKIEQELAELFALLREVRDEENATLSVAPCHRPKTRATRINPYWFVAASVLGFVLGITVPRENSSSSKEYTAQFTDTDHSIGRSLADGDVNFALLVK